MKLTVLTLTSSDTSVAGRLTRQFLRCTIDSSAAVDCPLLRGAMIYFRRSLEHSRESSFLCVRGRDEEKAGRGCRSSCRGRCRLCLSTYSDFRPLAEVARTCGGPQKNGNVWGQPQCGSGEFNGQWLSPTRQDAKIRVWYVLQANPCYALSQPPANQFIPIHSSAARSKHDHCLSLCASLPRFRKFSVLASSPPAGPLIFLQFYHPIPELLRDTSDCPRFHCN